MFTLEITEELAGKMSAAEAQKLIKGLCIPRAGLAVRVLEEVASNPRINPNARVSAAIALLDRGFGKPEQVQTVVAPGSGRSGVMLIDKGGSGGDDEWLRLSNEHHQKMLASPGPHSPDHSASS